MQTQILVSERIKSEIESIKSIFNINVYVNTQEYLAHQVQNFCHFIDAFTVFENMSSGEILNKVVLNRGNVTFTTALDSIISGYIVLLGLQRR